MPLYTVHNVSVCRGHELANALYMNVRREVKQLFPSPTASESNEGQKKTICMYVYVNAGGQVRVFALTASSLRGMEN